MTEQLNGSMVSWLIGHIQRQIKWLTEWMVEWLDGSVTEWLTCSLVEWLNDK